MVSYKIYGRQPSIRADWHGWKKEGSAGNDTGQNRSDRKMEKRKYV